MTSYETEVVPNAAAIPEEQRGELLQVISQIIRQNWTVSTPHWSNANTPFRDDHGMVLLREHEKIVAYTVYQRLFTRGVPTIYRSSTVVLPEYQGRGIYSNLTKEVLKIEFAVCPSSFVYYAWRTRSPVVWVANAKICTSVAPSIIGPKADQELLDTCVEIAGQVYPGKNLEVPRMVMRNVYGHITYFKEPKHPTAHEVNHWFNDVIPNTVDSVFCVGRVPVERKLVEDTIQRT